MFALCLPLPCCSVLCVSVLEKENYFPSYERSEKDGNSYSLIAQNLLYKEGTNKTRKEIIQEIFSIDPRRKTSKSGLSGSFTDLTIAALKGNGLPL